MTNLGCFYTPDKFVDVLLDMVKKEINTKDWTIADTSCGYGSMFASKKILAKRKILGDIDEIAIDTARQNFGDTVESFVQNALLDVKRENYKIAHDEKLILIGNPPYNDTTSQVKNDVKKSKPVLIDPDIKTRDLGISFMLSFNKLKADYVAVLHPLSYLIKKANFQLMSPFLKNYSIKHSVVISSQEFQSTSRIKGFPIVIALYKRGGETTFDDVMTRDWQTFCGKKFNLDKTYIGDIIKKYPSKLPQDVASPVLFWTMRDINALNRSRTFLTKMCDNAIIIDKSKFEYYCYVDVFKEYISQVPYFYGNSDIFILPDEFEEIKHHFVARSMEKHPHLGKSSGYDRSVLDNYFRRLLCK